MRPAHKVIRPVILALVLATGIAAGAQPSDTAVHRPSRAAVYFTGSYLVLYMAGNVNLQYAIWNNPDRSFSSIWLKAGGGRWYSYWDHSNGGLTASLEMMTMTGKGKHHFEFCAGASFFDNTVEYNWRYDEWEYEAQVYMEQNGKPSSMVRPEKKDYRSFLPSGSLGYRYQKPGAPPVFRIGVGFPDAVYVSFGLAF